MNQLPKSVGAGNPHATFCGNRGRATASGDPVGVETGTTGELVRHRQTKGAATDMFEPKATAPHLDSTALNLPRARAECSATKLDFAAGDSERALQARFRVETP